VSILEEIVARRKIRVSRNGASQGIGLPEKREAPLVPFASGSALLSGRLGVKSQEISNNNCCKRCFVIAEVKGRSPSAGIISSTFNPVSITAHYAEAGISEISVLTEEEYFGGSLQYLADIKNAFPEIAVLRKDFLLTEEDIDISWLAGADAVLLIASILDKKTLGSLLRRASKLGLASLVEVHSAVEIEKIREFKPPLVGINSRNLENFRVDKALPMMLAGCIDWDASLVFESGIKNTWDAEYAYQGGFSGVLCGEALVKDKNLAHQMQELALRHAAYKESVSGRVKTGDEFLWRRLYKNCAVSAGGNSGMITSPLVKICGITNMDDANASADMGADMIGLVFADSPRRAATGLPEKLSSLAILKTAVVRNPDSILIEYLKSLYTYGFIDAVQYHGSESPALCRDTGIPYYKSMSFMSVNNTIKLHTAGGVINKTAGGELPDYSLVYGCPRFLTDSSIGGKEGGTGVPVESRIVDEVRKREPLWLAGGLSDKNIKSVIERFSPELVDASSRLEDYHGKKDLKKLESFIRQIKGF